MMEQINTISLNLILSTVMKALLYVERKDANVQQYFNTFRNDYGFFTVNMKWQ